MEVKKKFINNLQKKGKKFSSEILFLIFFKQLNNKKLNTDQLFQNIVFYYSTIFKLKNNCYFFNLNRVSNAIKSIIIKKNWINLNHIKTNQTNSQNYKILYFYRWF